MAAGVELATAYVSLAVSAKDVGPQTRKAFSGIERDADASGKRVGKKLSSGIGGAVKGLGPLFAGVLAGIGVGNFLGDALGEARESQKVGALTESIIKSTGSAAKVTAKQVGDLATAISNKTGVDDEAIQSGANMLLTFKNVKNEVGKGAKIFDRATQAAADLSAAGFGDMAGQSKMLGKALNDPIKGIAALGRSGVTFTEQQKKQIKALVESGKTLEAQKIILGEVESQVGGAAAASATAGEKLSVVWGNFKETIGTALLPTIDKVASFLSGKLLPAAAQVFAVLFEGDFTSGPLSEDSKIVDTLFRIRDGIKTTFGVAKQFFDILFRGDFTSGPLSEDGKFVDVLFRLRDGFFKVRDGAVALGGWLRDNLWPALKDAYQTIMPSVKKAFDIVKGGGGSNGGGVDGAKGALKTFGEIITQKVIPFIAKLVSVWLPYAAFQLRALIEAVKAGWQAFQKFRDIAVPAISWIVRKFLDLVGVFVNGAAKAFGWMPGIGPKLKTAASEFNKFKDKVNSALDGINDKTVKVGVQFVAGTRVVMSEKSSGGGRRTAGGQTAFAAGGVLPGYTPGRDVHQFYSPTGGRLDLSGGEAIMRPEFTRLVGGKAGVDALNAQARRGRLQAFASGGVFASLPTRKGIDEGVDSATLDVVNKSARMLQDAARTMAGGPGMGWRAMVAWAKANIPTAAITSTVRHNNPLSDHDKGRAIDLAGGPGMSRIFDRISGSFPTSSVRSLYYSPKGANQIRFNRRSNTPPHIFNSHFDHVHWAMANGGVIPGREQGGPVLAGRPYVVGEKRPELFVPDTNGTILPSVGSGGPRVIQLMLPNGRVLTELVMDEMGEVISGGRTALVR